jgi:hypothetical protein
MMWTAHKIALFPQPERICGLDLMPPTVGQYQILEHLESPYTCGGLPSLDELAGAAIVCRLPAALSLWCIRRRWPFALLIWWL